jgi:hypothetical protein
MTTLRRELRTKFEGILNAFDDKLSRAEVEATSELLADAALEVRGIALSQQPLSIENAIYAGVEITTEIVERAQLRDLAPKMFEKALGFSKPLPWWNGKEWTAFGEWACDRYAESKSAFGEYNIWRATPYIKGSLSNPRIRSNVTEFYDSWDMFQMSQKPKTDEEKPSYKPYQAPEGNYVPRPTNPSNS